MATTIRPTPTWWSLVTASDGDYDPPHTYMVVAGHGFLIDLSRVAGELWLLDARRAGVGPIPRRVDVPGEIVDGDYDPPHTYMVVAGHGFRWRLRSAPHLHGGRWSRLSH